MIEKKMPFYMVCDGDFAKKFQELFEDAQIAAAELGGTVKITGSILVNPPEPGNPDLGSVSYETRMTLPPEKSGKYFTNLRSGIILDSKKTLEGLLQLELNFAELRKQVE